MHTGEIDWMLRGGGEAGALIRRLDWSRTPLGAIATWPKVLKTTVAMLVHSRHPMFLWWGPELIQVYNDAYLPSFGVGKHPAAMGQRGRDCWPEIWPIIGPQIDNVMRYGKPSRHEDVYWTYGYSPVFDEDGTIAGTLVVCTETTGRVLVTTRDAAIRAEVERDRLLALDVTDEVAARRHNEELAGLLRTSEAQFHVLLERERQARTAAEIASRAKDDFLLTASHELRTPLNAILGWARLLQSGQLDQSAFLRAIDTIERNARVQVRLIEDILDGSRIINGQLHLETRPLDMTAVVESAIDTVRAAADAKRIALTVSADPAAARVVADPERLQQVIWNLVTNAIKFTPKGGAVNVGLHRVGTDIELTVADNGEGIDAEFLPHVFERFRQAEGSTTRRHGGLGLGLALVRHLVDAHGGTVRADSAGRGLGATFIVTLPALAVLDERQATVAPRRDNGLAFVPRLSRLDGIDVLVVDDEADARDLVATVLRAKGAVVTVAANAADALELVATRAFMAMVSDVGMPGVDGYELIGRVRTMTGVPGRQLPAVALTAYSREEDRRRALDAGFNAYVSKPVEPDDLVHVVAGLVAGTQKRESETPAALVSRADTLTKFGRILNAQGVHEALRFLNSRTAHRFTGIYRYDAPTLRNLALLDAQDASVMTGDDAPMHETYCSIVGAFERPFTTDDALRDDRLREHPARTSVRSYCGVLLRGRDGTPFGTLCHFDVVPCDVPVAELALMEATAALIMRALG